jgi:glucosamine--fructose-6-phosphate aminotransferase (isomerizing)
MCGIVGYLGNNDANDYILSGLKLLQNRGYDSVGVSFVKNDKLDIIKYASTTINDSLSQLEQKIESEQYIMGSIAIGHTRWATHGSKTNANAHPHSDNLKRISLVHNGIIENFSELKKDLISEGYTFLSQTDTEIISVLIGKYLDGGETVEIAIQKTVDQLLGTWALVIIHKDFPNKMWITRNGSPLLLGMEEDFIMIASEQIAFSNYIKKYIVLDNHDLIEITKSSNGIEYNKNIQRYATKDKINVQIELTPLTYKHWMLKEIMEQPESVNRALNNGGRIENNVSVKLGGLDSCKNRLLELNHLILLGCGTSYNSALWSLDTFKSMDIFDTIVCYDGAEFNVKDIPKKGKTGVVLLSQSGETKDLHRCIQIAKDYDLITIGVVNAIDSLIARETDCGVYLNAGREVAVASTKSFTNQCVVLAMISVWFSQNRGTAIEKRRKIITDLRNLSFQMQKILEKEANMNHISTLFMHKQSLFILGKGKDEAVAKEGALKLKEIAYIHAEGYSSSALKHGPFALIELETPIIILDINDEYRDKNRNAFQEVSARNAFVLTITDINESANENSLVIEKNSTFGGLLANIYVQLISYYLAMANNYNPDFPRNLAKVVTVE